MNRIAINKLAVVMLLFIIGLFGIVHTPPAQAQTFPVQTITFQTTQDKIARRTGAGVLNIGSALVVWTPKRVLEIVPFFDGTISEFTFTSSAYVPRLLHQGYIGSVAVVFRGGARLDN
jgi:hypothetical protein